MKPGAEPKPGWRSSRVLLYGASSERRYAEAGRQPADRAAGAWTDAVRDRRERHVCPCAGAATQAAQPGRVL